MMSVGRRSRLTAFPRSNAAAEIRKALDETLTEE